MTETLTTFYAANTYLAQILLLAIVFFDLIFRGVALWRSARKSQKVWFLFLLIVNSAGILPIIYLLFNRKRKE